MPFLMSPTIIAVIIAALLQAATLGWGFVQSNRADRYEAKLTTCQAEHKAFVSQTEAVGRVAAAKAKVTEENNRRTADETAKGWASALAVVRADYAKRLRDASSRSAGGSGLSAPAQDRPGDAQTGPDAVPSPARVAADCAETTITLNYLQSYVERLQNE